MDGQEHDYHTRYIKCYRQNSFRFGPSLAPPFCLLVITRNALSVLWMFFMIVGLFKGVFVHFVESTA